MSDPSLPEQARPRRESAAEQSLVDAPTVLLFVGQGQNRRLLRKSLAEDHEVAVAESPEELAGDFDLCLVDEARYRRHRRHLEARKRAAGDAFLPVVLTVAEGSTIRSDPAVWDVVDDVVSRPVARAELRARLDALLDRRRQSLRLRDREERLDAALAELRIKERAIEAAPIGVTITDPDREDNPLIYVNEAFEDLTGYDRAEVVGRNCRFLQGPETDAEPVARVREAIDAEEQVSVELLNYEDCGRQFWNGLDVAPVRDGDGAVTHYVGFQRDVTDRKIREQRLTVLNRVLRHNLRNDLGVVLGFVETLQEEIDDPVHRSYLDNVYESTMDLVSLSDGVHDVQTALERLTADDRSVAVRPTVESVLADLRERYPDADLSASFEGTPLPQVPAGVREALREAVEIAVRDRTDAPVDVAVANTDDPPDGVVVTVTDHGGWISEAEKDALRLGEETQLEHADGVGVWLVYWIVRTLGGTVDVDDDSRGSVVTMRFAGESGSCATEPGREPDPDDGATPDPDPGAGSPDGPDPTTRSGPDDASRQGATDGGADEGSVGEE